MSLLRNRALHLHISGMHLGETIPLLESDYCGDGDKQIFENKLTHGTHTHSH